MLCTRPVMLGMHIIVTALCIFILSTVDVCSIMFKTLVRKQEIKHSLREIEKRINP
jgi:uncharacterized membrane protein